MQVITLRHGDSFVILATIPDGTLAALISDPPYGLEFMGKSWDKLWETGAGMSQPGIGDRAIPWPSFGNLTQFGGANPTCRECGGRLRGENTCECEEPVWYVNGEPVNAPNEFGQAKHVDQMRQMQNWHAGWLKEVFRCLKPGGIAKVFAATRTMHRLAAAMESVGFVLEPDHSIEAWAYGCLSDDTEILTKEGWVHYHKAKVGTEVLGFDLQTGGFTWQVVEETFEYPYDDNAFRIHGNGTDHIVSIGHRCVIENDGHWDFRISQEVPPTIVVPVLDGMSDMPQDVHAQDCEVTGLLHEMRQCGLPSGGTEA